MILLFLLSMILGYRLHQQWKPEKDIARVAVALRREKNRQYVKFIATMPNCNHCGGKPRPINLYPN